MHSLIKIAALSILALFCAACEEDPTGLNLPYHRDVPVLLATHVTRYDLREIHFTIDLAVFKADNENDRVIEYTDLPDSSFKFLDYKSYYGNPVSDTCWVRHTVEKVSYTDTTHRSSFATLILIDQSKSPESFDSSDYNNQRYEAFNAFYKNLKGQGKVSFAYYNRNAGEKEEMKMVNRELSDSWDEETAFSLLDLTHKQSGTSGLYDALDEAIDFISEKGEDNPSITLFVRNKDDGSSISLDNLILKAIDRNVKINVIWLIHNTQTVDLSAMRKLSTKTGGFEVYMNSIYQSTTVFLQLAKLLRAETNFYRVSVNMTIEDPNWFAAKYSTGIYLYYYTSPFYTWSYVPIYLEQI